MQQLSDSRRGFLSWYIGHTKVYVNDVLVKNVVAQLLLLPRETSNQSVLKYIQSCKPSLALLIIRTILRRAPINATLALKVGVTLPAPPRQFAQTRRTCATSSEWPYPRARARSCSW